MKGIDVSRWNNAGIDFKKVKEAGYDFVIIRAVGSNGSTPYKDKKFDQFYKGAVDAGLHVGAYAYVKPSYKGDIVAEANKTAMFFLDVIKDKKFDMPIYIDVETWKTNRKQDIHFILFHSVVLVKVKNIIQVFTVQIFQPLKIFLISLFCYRSPGGLQDMEKCLNTHLKICIFINIVQKVKYQVYQVMLI